MAQTPSGMGAAPAASPMLSDSLGASAGFDSSLTPSRPLDTNSFTDRAFASDEPWSWQLLPSGFMYKPNLASPQEYRLGSTWDHERNLGWLWNINLGGRAGLIRFGTENDFWPQGWQLDVDGGIIGRLDENHDVVSTDYHVCAPLTTRQGPWEFKFGYAHLSSHIADEYLLKNQGFHRLNYVRDSLVTGVAFYVNPGIRLYTEAGWAFYVDDGAEPWDFQFGADFSSQEPTGPSGAPFLALNTHLRQEDNFSGSFTMQTGWQWRGRTGHLMRIGVNYFNGMSEQYQFYNRFEEQIGAGLWYDY
jgi:hypothetical protein